MMAQVNTAPLENFVDEMSRTLGSFLPSLIWAIIILIVGWVVATVAASLIKNLLKRTNLDDRLANMIMGRDTNRDTPVEQWVATAVYWIILVFTLVAFLNALNLEVVSEPLNDFLREIFQYLPRIGGALVLLGVAWAIATIVKVLVTQGLARFNLDDRLSQQMGGERSPVMLNETVGNILYWFIFLLFVPLILSALDLPGLLAPIESLIDQFLTAIPRILMAAIILVVGWFIARIVRDIVTNLLQATQIDQLGERFGLSSTSTRPTAPTGTTSTTIGAADVSTTPSTDTDSGLSLSKLVGTIVFVSILISAVIAALNELDIDAISGPAISMLEQILATIPQIIMAGVVLAVAYVVGQFVSDLVTSLLRAAGFDNIFNALGLPELSAQTSQTVIDAEGRPTTRVAPAGRSPSEIAGLVALVGIVLFGAITATEILGFETLTATVQAILRIFARVLSGLVVFAIGLYFANLAFRLISNMGGGQANFLAQAARIAIITLVGAMGLQQMGVATDIVNLAFGLLLGAFAVAIAIAFGLGGRDIASEQVREWLNAFKRKQ
ncbi:mechanosensitive ion channel [Oscillatoria sp. CS-180]|uniref:mechanosensitive ion channel n=1 Tax=Oscillatoria sp. CS-180 TaxID=3021720 RepID=UPI00233121B4|nr:mechanosensitive ion channel [Oscillatoria sp. CS-180]MDB9528189.1 mechanosensitive ion channel [Oscillatoria sp. CS-180]